MVKTLEQLRKTIVAPTKGNKMSLSKGKMTKTRTKAQIGRSSRAKGAVGEREALKLIREWLTPVYESYGFEPEQIKRNLDQVNEGGFDLKGLLWLAPEVKRRETLSLGSWWKQTTDNAKPGEIPFLMYRTNRQPWKFKVRVPIQIGPLTQTLDVDMDAETACAWLKAQLGARLLARQRGMENDWFG